MSDRGLVREISAHARPNDAQYLNTIARWERWCLEHGEDPLPSNETVVLRYLHSHFGDWRPEYVRAIVNQLNRMHRVAGHGKLTGDRTTKYIQALRRVGGPSPKIDPIRPGDLTRLVVQVYEPGPPDKHLARLQGTVALALLLDIPIWVDERKWDGRSPVAAQVVREAITIRDDGRLRIQAGDGIVLLDPTRDPVLVAMVRDCLEAAPEDPRPFALDQNRRERLIRHLRSMGKEPSAFVAGDFSECSPEERQWFLACLDPHLEVQYRNAAYLLVGWSLACRHDDLEEMTIEGTHRVRAGFVITQKFSKTDRRGEGTDRTLGHADTGRACETGSPCHPLCAVRALTDWLAMQRFRFGRTKGPLFTSRAKGRSTSMTRSNAMWILRALWRDAGLDQGALIGTRSMRVGAATTAYEQRMPLLDIMDLLRHASPDVTQVYIRRHSPWLHRLSLGVDD